MYVNMYAGEATETQELCKGLLEKLHVEMPSTTLEGLLVSVELASRFATLHEFSALLSSDA